MEETTKPNELLRPMPGTGSECTEELENGEPSELFPPSQS